MNKKRTGRFIALALLLAGLCSTAQAVVKDYNGSQNVTTNFTSPLSWDGGVIPANNLTTDIARFNKTSYAYQLFHTGYMLNGIIFGDGTTATADITLNITGASGQQLRVGTGGVVMNANSGNATITKLAMPQDLSITNNSTNLLSIGTFGSYQTAGLSTATLGGSGRITFTGVVSDMPAGGAYTGTTALNVAGATVTLNGANTYSGTTTISAGTLNVGSGGTSGTLGNGGNVINNSALVINRSNAYIITNNISGTGTLTQSGAGTTTLFGNNSYTGTTTITSGTLAVGVGTNGTLGTGDVINNGILALNRTNSVTVANNISGTGSVIRTGANALTLSGNNTYSGNTTIANASDLSVSSDSNLGTGTNITVNQNGNLIITENMTTGKGISLLNGSPTLNVAAGKTLTVNGNVDANNSPRKMGSGTLRLNGNGKFGANSAFLMSQGGLEFGNAAALNGAALKFNGATSLDNKSGADLTATGMTGLQMTSGFTFTGTDNLDLSGASSAFVQTAGSIRNINVAAKKLTIGGILSTGTDGAGTARLDGGLIKSGAGTLELKGDSTYTMNTVVTNGTLIVNGGMLSSNVTVYAGATLGGTGVFQAVTVDAGGILSAGNSPGTMTFDGALTLMTGSTNIMEIVSASMYDVLKGNGANALTMNGETVFDFTGWTGGVTNGFSIVLSDMFQNWSSTNYTGATFAAKGLGGTQSLDFTGGVLTVIPEPATIGMLGLGALITLMLRRVRRTH